MKFQLVTRRTAQAHEGPVYVASLNRLYFATLPRLPAKQACVSLQYWDLSSGEIATWLPDARMANGVSLSCDESCLLVCEQGDRERPAAIARYELQTGFRESLVEDYRGKPFNSPNKVAELPDGSLLFTDPDYGRRQGFRPAAQPLVPATYLTRHGITTKLETGLEQPHGLAVSPDAQTVYLSDTSADDGVGGYDPSAARDVFRYTLNVKEGMLTNRKHLATVPKGIPDGMVCDAAGRLFCAVGDGVRVYTPSGEALHHEPLPNGAVNLYLHEASARLFVTTDVEVLVYALH